MLLVLVLVLVLAQIGAPRPVAAHSDAWPWGGGAVHWLLDRGFPRRPLIRAAAACMASYHANDFDYASHLVRFAQVELPPVTAVIEDGSDHINEPSKWEAFYTSNSGGGESYKARQYIHVSFADEWRRAGRRAGDGQILSVLEVGAGEGSTIRPLCAALSVQGFTVDCVATDCSRTAVERLQSLPEVRQALVWDVTTAPHCQIVGEFDIVLCIFTLSAIHPDKHVKSLLHMRRLLKPGGRLLLRDYAFGDATMMKHQNRISNAVFERKDGTLAVYLTVGDLFANARAADLAVVQQSVCCVVENNRKTKKKRERCFLHVVLEATPPPVRRVLNAAAVDELLDINSPPPLGIQGGRAVIRGKIRSSEADQFEAGLRGSSAPLISLDVVQGCTGATLSRLLAAIDLSLLQDLNVEDNKLPNIRIILKWLSNLTSLRSLNLSGNVIDGRDCEQLSQWLRHGAAPLFRRLSARNCSICVASGDASYLMLTEAAAASCQSLRTLDLGHESRLSSQSFFNLTRILGDTCHLRDVTLDRLLVLSSAPACCFLLGKSVGRSSIERLSVASSRIDDECLEALTRGLSQGAKAAFSLVLDDNPFRSSAALHRLLSQTSRVHLEGLSLVGCRLDPRSHILLAGRIATSQHLKYLNLENNALPAVFMTVLTSRLDLAWKASACPSAGAHNSKSTPPLTHLVLSANAVGSRCVHRLFSLLQTHVTTHPLRVIQMLNCLPGPVGLASINTFLETDRRLMRLEMRVSDDCTESPLSRLSQTLFFVEWPMHCKIAFLAAIRKPKSRQGGRSRYALDADSILPIFSFLTRPVSRQLVLI